MRGDVNFVEILKLLQDFKNDLKELGLMISKNKGAVNDVRKDFKKFIEVMDRLTKEENMRTFKKFVNELERFNKNAEEMKDVMKNFDDLVKTLKVE